MKIWRLLLVCCLLLVAGCATPDKESGAERREWTDATGKVVQVSVRPQRIVSLTLGTDEMLYELVPMKRIAAVTSLADDATVSYVAGKWDSVPKRVHEYTVEEIFALQPDLVLIADWWNMDGMQTLRELGVPVYVYHSPYAMADVIPMIREVANVVGEPQRGEEMVKAYTERWQAVTREAAQVPADSRRRVLIMSGNLGFGGQDSLLADMLSQVQADNVLADIRTRTIMLSQEAIIDRNPDVMIIPEWTHPGLDEILSDRIMTDPSFQTLRAVQEQRVHMVSGKAVHCMSQYLTEGLRELGAAVYPEYIRAVEK